MQPTNIAIGNGATIEYQPDGTLIVRPTGTPVQPTWSRGHVIPAGVAQDNTRYSGRAEYTYHGPVDIMPQLAMLQKLLAGIKLSELRTTTRNSQVVAYEKDTLHLRYLMNNEILVISQNDVVMNIYIIGVSQQITIAVPHHCVITGLCLKAGGWHRTDYQVQYTQPVQPPLTQAAIAIALIDGTINNLLPKRELFESPEEVLCVNSMCALDSAMEALLVVATPERSVRSITSADTTHTVVFASVDDVIIVINTIDGVVEVKDYVAVAKLKPTPLETLQAYIKDNLGRRVNITLSASEIRTKYQSALAEQGYVLTDRGVIPYGKVPHKSRCIALMCRDHKTETIYVAALKFDTIDAMDSNIRYLADAILGVDSDPVMLNNIIRSGGLYAECYRATSTLDVKVEERRYIPFIEYYKSLEFDARRVEGDYTAKVFREIYGTDLSAVANLMLVTSKGVCPWVGTGQHIGERLMITYLSSCGALRVSRYMALSKNDYREAIKVLSGKDYDVNVIDTIFGTVNGVYTPTDDTTSNP